MPQIALATYHYSLYQKRYTTRKLNNQCLLFVMKEIIKYSLEKCRFINKNSRCFHHSCFKTFTLKSELVYGKQATL